MTPEFLFGFTSALVLVIFVGYFDAVIFGEKTIKKTLLIKNPFLAYMFGYVVYTAWEFLFFVGGYLSLKFGVLR